MGNWVGVIGAVTALLLALKALADWWQSRKKDTAALKLAELQAPDVTEQLRVGNFKGAIEGVNLAQQMTVESLKSAREEIEVLREHERAAEAEAAGWEKRYRESEARAARAEARHQIEVSELRTKITECEARISELMSR